MTRNLAKDFIISFVINLAIAFIAIFVFGSKLFMNDDSSLAYMFFGIMGKASERACFINPVLGTVYKELHRICPAFNWMTFSYYFWIIVSGTMAFYSILKRNKKTLIILWLLFELVFFHDIYVYLTYSAVTAFVAGQSFLSIFVSMDDERKSIWLYIINGICLLFSSMLRFDGFLGIAAFAFVIWVLFVLSDLKKLSMKDLLKKYVFPFAVIIGICFVFLLVDKACYTKGEWKAYIDYESERRVVSDYRNSVKIERYKPLRELGVSKNQALAVLNFRNNDPEILDTELVKKIADTTKLYNGLLKKYVWKDFIRQWKIVFTKYMEIYFSLLEIVFLMVYLSGKRARIWMPLVLLSPMLLELFYFAYIGRLDNGEYPERCIYIVLMGIAVEVMALMSKLDNNDATNNKRAAVILGLLCISSIIVQPTKNFSVDGLGLVDTNVIEERYDYLRDGNVYVVHYSFMQDFMSEFGAWQNPSTGFLDHCVEIGGYFINHPMQNELQISLGCVNPYRALFEKENVFYLTEHTTQDSVLEYLKENYDDRIKCDLVDEKEEVKIYKFGID